MMLRITIPAVLFAMVAAIPAQAQINVSSQVVITSGSCTGCDFSNKTMPRMSVRDSNFSGSLFNRANLSGGQFTQSDLSGAHFRKAFLARIESDQVDFSGARMEDVTLTEAKLLRTNMEGSDLRRADLSRAELIETNLIGADLSNAIAVGAKFDGSKFTGARLLHADLLGARLDDGLFRGVRFGSALMKGASLKGAVLSGADLSGVQGLTQVQLDEACGDMETRLPVNLSIAYCASDTAENIATHNFDHHILTARDEYVALRLDKVISRIETILPDVDASTRRELQKVHADALAARRQIEKHIEK